MNILETALGFNALVEGDLVKIDEPKDIKKQRDLMTGVFPF